MTLSAEQMTSTEAAEQLGVGVRQVERLVASGDLARVGTVGRVALIDAASVYRLREQGVRRGRPWSLDSIRAAIDLLADGATERLETSQRSRLRSRLRAMTAEDLVRATRGRASVSRYRASNSFLDRIRSQVTLTGHSAVDADRATAGVFGLAASRSETVDGYVTEEHAELLAKLYHLAEDAAGNVTLRVVAEQIAAGGIADSVTVALDLAESLNVRERSAGLAVLTERLIALQ